MKLKVAFNIHKIEAPYGGANQFANVLERYLLNQGHEVSRTLQPKLDLILIISSQWNPTTTSFSLSDIEDYLQLHPETAVIQRVNTLDEPRGVDLGINQAICEANRLADHTVFVSNFVKEIFEKKGLGGEKPNSVILNGADEAIFNPSGRSAWDGRERLRIVTHHWSANYLKGFDIYERLDLLLGTAPYHSLFEFCFIGNLPLGLELRQTRVIAPTWGKALGDLLRQQHIYLTAARHEASGQHHIEGMRCGLPVLYLNSGALPEYCRPFGIEFTLINFEQKLLEIRSSYHELYQAVQGCPYKGEWMSKQYEELFINVVSNKRSRPPTRTNAATRFKIHLINRPLRRVKNAYRLLKKAFEYLQKSRT